MNTTVKRFGHPATLISEHEHWVVLLRPSQPTLGSLILAAKGEVMSFSDVSERAFNELNQVIRSIERTLTHAVEYDRINYLMLMMLDPHVHFHVLPRYSDERTACGFTIRDAGWPGLPLLEQGVVLAPKEIDLLVKWLKAAWA